VFSGEGKKLFLCLIDWKTNFNIERKAMNKKIVTFGEIMLRLATPGYECFSQAMQSYERGYLLSR
jgi:hypothetical protein